MRSWDGEFFGASLPINVLQFRKIRSLSWCWSCVPIALSSLFSLIFCHPFTNTRVNVLFSERGADRSKPVSKKGGKAAMSEREWGPWLIEVAPSNPIWELVNPKSHHPDSPNWIPKYPLFRCCRTGGLSLCPAWPHFMLTKRLCAIYLFCIPYLMCFALIYRLVNIWSGQLFSK